MNISALRRAIGDGHQGSGKYIETIPRVGYRFIAPVREVTGAAGEPGIHSIAVLPLSNLSADPEQEYFADGMTEELITELAKISALRVISRTSAMHFKDTRDTVPISLASWAWMLWSKEQLPATATVCGSQPN